MREVELFFHFTHRNVEFVELFSVQSELIDYCAEAGDKVPVLSPSPSKSYEAAWQLFRAEKKTV